MYKLEDVYLLDAKEGLPTKILIGDLRFIVALEAEPEPIIELIETETIIEPETKELKRHYKKRKIVSSDELLGPTIGRVGNTRIYKNLYEKISEAIDEGMSSKKIKKIIKKAKPNVKKTTISNYLSCNKMFKKNPNNYQLDYEVKRNIQVGKKKPKAEKLEITDFSLDKPIGKVGNIYVHENLFKIVSKLMDEGKSRSEVQEIIHQAKPHLVENSLSPYYYGYKTFKENPDAYRIKRKYRKRKQEKQDQSTVDKPLHSKTYNTDITQDEFDTVKKAIVHVELNYVPNLRTLKSTTKINDDRLLATLDVMREEKYVNRNFVNDEYVYEWIVEEQTEFGCTSTLA